MTTQPSPGGDIRKVSIQRGRTGSSRPRNFPDYLEADEVAAITSAAGVSRARLLMLERWRTSPEPNSRVLLRFSVCYELSDGIRKLFYESNRNLV